MRVCSDLARLVFVHLLLLHLKVVSCGCHEYNPIYRTFRADPNDSSAYELCKRERVPEKYARFYFDGVSPIFWDETYALLKEDEQRADTPSTTANTTSLISKECATHLFKVYEGLNDGRVWAFKFLDSGSASPSGIWDGSTTDLGEYVQCLELSHADIDGKYCQMTAFPEDTVESRLLRLDAVKFVSTGFAQAVCLPASCNMHEIHGLLTRIFACYELHIPVEAIHCDTALSTSFAYRLERLTVHQKVSMYVFARDGKAMLVFAAPNSTSLPGCEKVFRTVLAAVMACLLLGTAVDLLSLREDVASRFLRHFSLRRNHANLFAVNNSSPRTNERQRIDYVDLFKLYLIVLSLVAHIVFCIETPMFTTVIRHFAFIRRTLETPYLAFIVADGGFVTLSFMGGFASYFLISSRTSATHGKPADYFGVALEKWLRYLPAIIGLLCLEFCWPLLSSGPFYTPVSNLLMEKCTRYWLMNIFFISNWISAEKICMGHTYYGAVDIQLFLLGLVVVYLLRTRPRLGVAFSTALVVVGYALIYFFARKHQTPPFLTTPDLDHAKIVSFLNYVHMATHGYLSTYFIGMLMGHAYSCNIRAARDSRMLYGLASAGSQLLALASPMLHNGLGLIPQNWIPLYILVNKTLFTISVVTAFKYLETFQAASSSERIQKPLPDASETPSRRATSPRNEHCDEEVGEMPLETGAHQRAPQSRGFSWLRGFSRLSFAMYMANYYYIRTEFFADRALKDNSFDSWGKRIIYSYEFILLYAYAFHMLFVAPFESLRKAALCSTHKPKQL